MAATRKPAEPEPSLEYAATLAREWTTRRDEQIVELHRQGRSLRDIAAMAGLSHTAIAKIVERDRVTP